MKWMEMNRVREETVDEMVDDVDVDAETVKNASLRKLS